MAKQRATAIDVARRAGVSQPTVSRVFSPGARVSGDLAKRVLAAAEELGYRPNTLARSLNTGRSRVIGLVVAYLGNPFYTEALERFSTALNQRGYHILVFLGASEDSDIDQIVEDLMAHQVEGIICASVGLSDRLTDRVTGEGIPLVLFNRGQDDPRLSSVTSANYQGGHEVARFLARGGHRHIAHISGWQGSTTGRDRRAGFLAGLAAHGLDPAGDIDGGYTRTGAAAAARALFRTAPFPDAIFVGNDHMAFAVMETLRGPLALDIPGDVSIVGYDDVAMAAWPSFELTTARQPAPEMVEAAIELLMARIEGRDSEARQLEIPSPLVLRKSARIPLTTEEP